MKLVMLKIGKVMVAVKIFKMISWLKAYNHKSKKYTKNIYKIIIWKICYMISMEGDI